LEPGVSVTIEKDEIIAIAEVTDVKSR
jgi:hypothetical protein